MNTEVKMKSLMSWFQLLSAGATCKNSSCAAYLNQFYNLMESQRAIGIVGVIPPSSVTVAQKQTSIRSQQQPQHPPFITVANRVPFGPVARILSNTVTHAQRERPGVADVMVDACQQPPPLAVQETAFPFDDTSEVVFSVPFADWSKPPELLTTEKLMLLPPLHPGASKIGQLYHRRQRRNNMKRRTEELLQQNPKLRRLAPLRHSKESSDVEVVDLTEDD